MSRKSSTVRSVNQRVGNAAREHKLIRVDAFAAYVMDRLLYRLGRSSQVDEFYLKGGVLVANLVDEPYRFTRDIDFLRRKGPPDPDEIRGRFEDVIAVAAGDGIVFGKVRTVRAERDEDDYDGVKAFIAASIEGNDIEIRVDIGFGDAVEPPVERIRLTPFLHDDPPASLRAYPPGPVVAEKVQTVLSKSPRIRHRLKDILDVAVLSDRLEFDGAELLTSLQATFDRRETPLGIEPLDAMAEELRGRRWEQDWAVMVRDKSAKATRSLTDAVVRFDRFVRPILLAMATNDDPGTWPRGGPWTPPAIRGRS
jgi:hypothetical protein